MLNRSLGGGSVFFAKEPAKKNVINDKNKELADFYRSYQKNGCKIVNECKLPKTDSQFQKVKEGKGSCNFYGRIKTSYACTGKNFNSTKRPDGSWGNGSVMNQKNCDKQMNLLKNTKIENKDWKQVVRENDGKNTLFYLDPPYHGTSNPTTYADRVMDPKEVCKIAKNIKGKVILSYNDHKDVRSACKGLRMKKVKTTYETNKSKIGQSKEANELLIMNF
ncbi:MAG: DNA adenine methylase [Candidatus Daviesbacteria bacterium]|nr:DNA adenine methylase [Candidatus Daviesbacteria bacterium]